MQRVERRVVIQTTRPSMWGALTDGLSAWFGATVASGSFEPGSHLEFRWDDGMTRAAVIEEVERERLLAFRWLPFARDADGTPVRRDVTRVALRLEDEPAGIALIVTETSMSARASAAGAA